MSAKKKLTIAIAGLTGSGKNTLGEGIAKSLKLTVVCPTFKDLARREGVSLMEFQKRAERDHDIDKKFDIELKKQAKNGNCVVTTWLGPWMIDADIKIWVFAPLSIRAQRIANRDKMTGAEAKRHIIERDERNRKRYLDVYGIDIYNTDIFDFCINNGRFSAEETQDIVLCLVLKILSQKGKKKK